MKKRSDILHDDFILFTEIVYIGTLHPTHAELSIKMLKVRKDKTSYAMVISLWKRCRKFRFSFRSSGPFLPTALLYDSIKRCQLVRHKYGNKENEVCNSILLSLCLVVASCFFFTFFDITLVWYWLLNKNHQHHANSVFTYTLCQGSLN